MTRREHFENLHVGNWVTPVEVVEYEQPMHPMHPGAAPPEPEEYWSRRTANGMPLQIKAMSWPWLVVCDGERRWAIDSRNVKLVKLNRAYVREAKLIETEEIQWEEEPASAIEDPGGRCPRCHYPGQPRQVMTIGGGWHLECPNCGLRSD